MRGLGEAPQEGLPEGRFEVGPGGRRGGPHRTRSSSRLPEQLHQDPPAAPERFVRHREQVVGEGERLDPEDGQAGELERERVAPLRDQAGRGAHRPAVPEEMEPAFGVLLEPKAGRPLGDREGGRREVGEVRARARAAARARRRRCSPTGARRRFCRAPSPARAGKVGLGRRRRRIAPGRRRGSSPKRRWGVAEEARRAPTVSTSGDETNEGLLHFGSRWLMDLVSMCRPGRGGGRHPPPCPLRGLVPRGVRRRLDQHLVKALPDRGLRRCPSRGAAVQLASCRRPPLSSSFDLPPTLRQERANQEALQTLRREISLADRVLLYRARPLPAEHEVTAFLTHLATKRHVSTSTQNQALSALLFLYRHVLDRDSATSTPSGRSGTGRFRWC